MSALVGRPAHAPARLPLPGAAGVAAVALAALAGLFIAFPLVALLTHTSAPALAAAVGDPVVLDALRISALTVALSTALVVAAGTPLALVLARARFPGRGLLEALVGLPLVLPPVVAGLALLFAFSRTGPIGGVLDALGLHIPLSTTAVVLAQAFVAAPLYVYALTGAFAHGDDVSEEMAGTLGASPWRVFRTVTLPLARPALVYGAVLAAARGLGEFGATITVAGNVQGRTQTMPTAIYLAFERDPDGAVALAAMLAATSFALLVALRGLRVLRLGA